MFSLQGKSAVVTGGGQGIGLGISKALLEAGASLLIAQRSPLPEDLANNRQVLWIEADLSHADSFEVIAGKAKDQFPQLDIDQ